MSRISRFPQTTQTRPQPAEPQPAEPSPHPAFDEPRQQASVRKVAAILDYSERFVRELCNRGELETNGRPGRGFRIFLDSVVAYQRRNRRVG